MAGYEHTMEDLIGSSWWGTNIIQLFSGGVRTCRTDGHLVGYERVTENWRSTNVTHTQLYIYR